jgi:DNA-directed RNA polymerase specialized sigma24 family protein
LIESDFVEELKAKHEYAYAKLIDLYEQKVFSTCMSFIPNRADAEDVAQDVFIEVFNSIQKFKGDSKLSTWIYRITTNLSVRKKLKNVLVFYKLYSVKNFLLTTQVTIQNLIILGF